VRISVKRPFYLTGVWEPRLRLERIKRWATLTSEHNDQLHNVEEALEGMAAYEDDYNQHENPGNVQVPPLSEP
jgi:hypothetical protein